MKKAILILAVAFFVFSLLSPIVVASAKEPISRSDPECDALNSAMADELTSQSYEPVMAASTYFQGRAVIAGDHNWISSGSTSWCNYYDNLKLLVNICNWFYPYLPRDSGDPGGEFPHIVIDCTKMDPVVQYTPNFTYAINALYAAGWYWVEVWSAGMSADYARIVNDPYYRVLIICWPCKSFSPGEVIEILNFTDDNARGLLFLGEYGTCWSELSGGLYPAAAAAITGPLGVYINDNILYDPTDYVTRMWWPKITVFPGGHPTTSGISTFVPAATATLSIGSQAVAIATGDADTYVTKQSCKGVGGFYIYVDKTTLLAPQAAAVVSMIALTVCTVYTKNRLRGKSLMETLHARAADITRRSRRRVVQGKGEEGECNL